MARLRNPLYIQVDPLAAKVFFPFIHYEFSEMINNFLPFFYANYSKSKFLVSFISQLHLNLVCCHEFMNPFKN
jgi:hypothetical protein